MEEDCESQLHRRRREDMISNLTVFLCLIWAATILYGEKFAFRLPPYFTCSWPWPSPPVINSFLHLQLICYIHFLLFWFSKTKSSCPPDLNQIRNKWSSTIFQKNSVLCTYILLLWSQAMSFMSNFCSLFSLMLTRLLPNISSTWISFNYIIKYSYKYCN